MSNKVEEPKKSWFPELALKEKWNFLKILTLKDFLGLLF